MAKSEITDEQMKATIEAVRTKFPDKQPKAWLIKGEILANYGVSLDESTIRGRCINMNMNLSSILSLDEEKEIQLKEEEKKKLEEEEKKKKAEEERAKAAEYKAYKEDVIPQNLRAFIPPASEFVGYIERPQDKILAVAYDNQKHPLTQGKQGTGKTYSHMYYAHKMNLPFFLFSCHEDMKLHKLFGEKTIINGSVVFQDSVLIEATQCPSVILFDEINALGNKNTFDFHALLQNRELYIKDKGIVQKLHTECRIGFAQNPKSAKYIGGNILSSNFLGRCTCITYPEFTKDDLNKSVYARFPKHNKNELSKFVTYYCALLEVIDRSKLPIDISIRQLFNTLDLYTAGLPLVDALNAGIIHALDAISQPTAKEAIFKVAQGVWKDLITEEEAKAGS